MQVVFLKIDNLGDVAFNYKVAVTVEGSINSKNARGEDIYLPDYLRYGAVFGHTEAEVEKLVEDRLASRSHASKDWGALGTWAEVSPYTVDAGDESHYGALIIYMPEEESEPENERIQKYKAKFAA